MTLPASCFLTTHLLLHHLKSGFSTQCSTESLLMMGSTADSRTNGFFWPFNPSAGSHRNIRHFLTLSSLSFHNTPFLYVIFGSSFALLHSQINSYFSLEETTHSLNYCPFTDPQAISNPKSFPQL